MILAIGAFFRRLFGGKKKEGPKAVAVVRGSLLDKALASYQAAAASPQLHDYALYKQGWCYFNLGDYHRAMDMFREVAIDGKTGDP